MTSVLTIQADAASECPVCGEFHASLSGVSRFFYNVCCEVYGGNLFVTETTGEEITTQDALMFDVNSNQDFAAMWGAAEQLYDTVAVIGELLVIVHFMVYLLEMVTADTLNPERFFKMFIKLVAGILIVKNGFAIAEAGLTLATVVFNKMAQTPPGGMNKDACNYDALKKDGFNAILSSIPLLLPYLVMMAAKAFVSIVCWFRIMDVLVRVIFSPVGLSDLIFEGTQGHGFMYLKKIIASALQGAAIIGITKGYSAILSILGGVSGWAITVIMAVCVIITIRKASTYANDAMGT